MIELEEHANETANPALFSIAISLKRIADALEVALGILLEQDTDDDDAFHSMTNQS